MASSNLEISNLGGTHAKTLKRSADEQVGGDAKIPRLTHDSGSPNFRHPPEPSARSTNLQPAGLAVETSSNLVKYAPHGRVPHMAGTVPADLMEALRQAVQDLPDDARELVVSSLNAQHKHIAMLQVELAASREMCARLEGVKLITADQGGLADRRDVEIERLRQANRDQKDKTLQAGKRNNKLHKTNFQLHCEIKRLNDLCKMDEARLQACEGGQSWESTIDLSK